MCLAKARAAAVPLSLLLLSCGERGPAATVLDAGEIGTLAQSSLIVGRDGACSARVWDNHVVWLFGDTFLGVSNAQGITFVSNTFALSASQVPDSGLVLSDRLDDAGAPDQLLLPTADEETYDLAHRSFSDGGCAEAPCGGRWATWPGSTVFDPADGGTALTFYGLIRAAPGDFNFSGVGQSIAVWTDFSSRPTRPQSGVCPGHPTLLFCQDEPGYGNGAVTMGGDIYTFACPRDGLSFHCQLGRVPFAQALSRSAWQYWDGNQWSGSLSASRALFDGAANMGVFFNTHIGQWMVVYAGTFSNRVVFRTAPAITGPWSGEGKLFDADRKGHGGTTYDALPHPELSEADGQVLYVTFSRSTSLFGSEFALVRVVFQ